MKNSSLLVIFTSVLFGSISLCPVRAQNPNPPPAGGPGRVSKAVMLMIGTNNTGGTSGPEIAGGIRRGNP